MKEFTIEFTGLFKVQAQSEEEAREKWSDADFGDGEDLDIIDIRQEDEDENI